MEGGAGCGREKTITSIDKTYGLTLVTVVCNFSLVVSTCLIFDECILFFLFLVF